MTTCGGVAGTRRLSCGRATMLPVAAIGSPLVVAYNVGAVWPLLTRGDPWLAAATMLVSVAYFLTGTLVATDPGHRSTAVALWLAGLLWPLNWLNRWEVGPLPLLAALEGPLASLFAVWALLRYPEPWATRRQERVVVTALLGVQVVGCLTVVLSRPQWQDVPAGDPWLTLSANHSAYGAASVAYSIGAGVTALAAATTIVVRLRRLTGPDRRVMQPVIVAVPIAAVFTTVSAIGTEVVSPAAAQLRLDTIESVALAGVPVAFMLAAFRRLLAGESAHTLIRRLGVAPTPEEIEAAIRELLAAPSLILIYRTPRGHVDVFGRPAVPPSPGDARLISTVAIGAEHDGVLLVGDPSLRRHSRVVQSVTRAAAFALENTQLQAIQRNQINQLAASADRLREAVTLEQRRVSHAVTAIIDTRLNLVSQHLSTLENLSRDQGQHNQLIAVRGIIDFAVDTLHTLAAGDFPADLAEHGLASAISSNASHLAGNITVSIPAQRFDTTVEETAYFAICELVANATKHALARNTVVRGSVAGNALVVEVSDDGRGGADPAGSGLAGLARRVEAVGGRLTLHSVRGTGTNAVMHFPSSPRATRHAGRG